ncbi:MAG: hypothetical protein NTV22_15515 [bacterium]|nr:hypothetical protein [bacterium]
MTKPKRKTAKHTTPRARPPAQPTVLVTVPVQAKGVVFTNSRKLMTECAALYSAHKAGRLLDDTARTSCYILQTAAGILRTCSLEQRVSELEKTLAIIDADREQTHGAM